MEGSDVLHVEICRKSGSVLEADEIEKLMREEIESMGEVLLDSVISGSNLKNDVLREHVESVICSCNYRDDNRMKVQGVSMRYYTYTLTQENVAMETMENESEELPVSSHWILPAAEFHYLWENLYFPSHIKDDLLHFVETTMIFSDHNVNANVISWNKVVLLHGPPGTGKTSLCRALAQKVSIRLGHRFTYGQLIEINSHSLFSKWYSESAKLVMKLFNQVKSSLEDPNALVCILIDEVESLAHTRETCTSGSEPADSIRVVNALLTQLDQLKRYPNALILTTSNLSDSIDLAFVDRADIKQYIGNPLPQAIYKIYYSCLQELMGTKLIEQEKIYDLSYLQMKMDEENPDMKNSVNLMKLSTESSGLTGRTLRRIPFLAYALYVRSKECTLPQFLKAMHLTVKRQREECTD